MFIFRKIHTHTHFTEQISKKLLLSIYVGLAHNRRCDDDVIGLPGSVDRAPQSLRSSGGGENQTQHHSKGKKTINENCVNREYFIYLFIQSARKQLVANEQIYTRL
jgi:hypothetical protein